MGKKFAARSLAGFMVLLAVAGGSAQATSLPVQMPAGEADAQIKAPSVVEVENADGTITIIGLLEWDELEGGFYRVGNWAMLGERSDLERLKGKIIEVTGKRADGPTIHMVKTLTISKLAAKEAALPALPDAKGRMTVEGTIEYVDLEGGYYKIGDWALMGDQKLLASLKSQQVLVRGKKFEGMSIRMVPELEVELIAQAVSAKRSLPTAVHIGDFALPQGLAPQVVDGVLMLPLRMVAEKAGGKVEWDPKAQAIAVTMPDRKAFFAIGQGEAEVNINGHVYIRRNMIAMAKGPILYHGHTHISADALTQILGLWEAAGLDTDLDLTLIK